MSREDLPDGWHATRLGDVITGFETGRSLSASGRRANADEVGVLKISAVTWGEFRPEENKALPAHHNPRPHEFVRSGDLLITRANTSELVGAVALVLADRLKGQPRLVLPDKILRILPKADVISPNYLLYALRAPEVRGHFAENATGTRDSMRNLSQPKLAAAPILLPPLAEQHRIVDRIDALHARTIAARERLTRVREILVRFRQSVLAAACSGRLTGKWRARHVPEPLSADSVLGARQRAWIRAETTRRARDGRPIRDADLLKRYVAPAGPDEHGDAPDSWLWTTLDQITILSGGLTKGQKRRAHTKLSPVPYLRVANVQRGHIDLSVIKEIEATEAEISELQLISGDILLNEGGDIDKLGRG